jgi:hypothetical protein
MSLKRLAILLAILIFLAGVGIAWLWQYAYTPEGRARVIIAQLKGDTTSLRGWMLQHHIVRPGFVELPIIEQIQFPSSREIAATNEMAKLGPDVMPVVIEALQDDGDVRLMAIRACGKFRDPAAIEPLAKCMRETKRNFLSANPSATWDCEGTFQLLCLESMAEIGPEAYVPLMEASRGFDSDTRGMIPVDISEKWRLTAAPYLMKLLEDSDMNVRANAALELAKLEDKRALPAISKLLIDPDKVVRKAAVVALKHLGVNPDPASQPGKP